jgi:general secretion pathway protein A
MWKKTGYLEELQLHRNPFPVAPDDDHFYLSRHIEQVMTEIVHGIETRKGFMVLSGEVGLGKTTLVRRIMGILDREKIHTALVLHTSLKDVELLREINRDFGLQVESAATGQFGDYLRQLNEFLLECYRVGSNCAILIDDAQNLDRASLELVRMISNLETDGQKLVQVLLVGQTELMENLSHAALRQLRSRIIIDKRVRPLSADELRGYVDFKLSLAGNQGRITVTADAIRRIHSVTRGNFRHVNIAMDRCLYAICRDGTLVIDGRAVKVALADLCTEYRTQRPRMLRWAVSAAVMLTLATGSWALHLRTGRQAEAQPVKNITHYKVPPIPNPPPGSPLDDADSSAFAEPPVTAFLRAHHLERYADAFQRATDQGNLALLGQRIFRESGWQLVQLNSLPEVLRARYGALALSGAADRSVRWALLWRPTVDLQRFYYRYQGEEIRRLQQLLSQAGLYQHKIDGVVGTRLMEAVIAFQNRYGLGVSGFPDAETLFMLCNANQEGAR